jgi:hypothetical protein
MRYVSGFIFIGYLLIVVSGCGYNAVYKSIGLDNDTLSDPKYQSIVFGRVRMSSKTEPIYWKKITVDFLKADSPKIHSILVEIDYDTAHVLKKGVVNTAISSFDMPFFAEVEPGDYSLQTVGAGYFTAIVDGMESSIPPNSLVYFGVIEVEFLSASGKSEYFIQIKNEIERDLNVFQTNYPLLYEQFKDNVITVME